MSSNLQSLVLGKQSLIFFFFFFNGSGWQDPMGDSHGEQKDLGKRWLSSKETSSKQEVLPVTWKKGNLKKRQAGFREVQTGQPHLALHENYGANPHGTQEGD